MLILWEKLIVTTTAIYCVVPPLVWAAILVAQYTIYHSWATTITATVMQRNIVTIPVISAHLLYPPQLILHYWFSILNVVITLLFS
jgi:hypothetical protein